ncbi:hypothetical protein FOZ62_004928 [Perkinsus olseni]|uniref:Uncharacterized protein n=1 Tax=Perkinsus olseni TaxID=32597 RepID=A0A7J6SXT4_PEROL|nr:hypothetical protein FOZ62_004928 [Perkinsus olseni]
MLSLVCVSGGGPKQITSYVQPKDLPAGTYKAVEQSGEGVCPGLPDLVDFEMVVRNGPQGQSATLGFQDHRGALADQPPTSSRGRPFELAFHSRQNLETLKRIGPFETGKLLKCFGLEPRTRASTFVSDLYARLSLVKPPSIHFYARIMFCQIEDVGLVVGIGRNVNKNGKVSSFEYAFKLELQSAKKAAVRPKEGCRKRVSPSRIRIAPPKRPREAEEVSAAMNAHQASSLPDTGDLQVHHLPVSNAAEDAASPPFEDVKKAVD